MRFVRSVAAVSVVGALIPAPARAGELPKATELLDASIAFHDPEGVWETTPLELRFEETRPDGSVRETGVFIDIAGERFSWSTTREGRRLAGVLAATQCELSLDGRTELSAAERAEHRLTCERLEWMRDYYTYLWGLPMKLRDPGTRLSEAVVATEFQETSALALKATYEEEVGSDTWYFYFDPASSALLGYRFFHDESQNDGEYITLEDTEAEGSLRLPRTRAWYTHQGDRYLGTDTLVSLQRYAR